MHDGYNNFVQIRVKNHHIRALVDSGAAKSCISEAFFHKLKLPSSALKKPVLSHLVSANKSPMHNLGMVDLNILIQGLSIPYQFCVLRGLSYQCILGVDWLYDVKGQINFANGVLSVYDNLLSVALIRNVDRSSLLLLSKPLTIPPLTEALVPVVLNRKFNNVVSLVETFQPIKTRLLAVAA